MSNRSIKKRRHRQDFEQYMEQRKTALKGGFSSLTAYQFVLDKLAEMKQKHEEQTIQLEIPVVGQTEHAAFLDVDQHVHGSECKH